MVAVVGPNESGKTSLLEALSQATRSGIIQRRDLTRGHDLEEPILEIVFLLDTHDQEAFQRDYRNMPNIRWLKVAKPSTGEISISSSAPLPEKFKSEALSRLPCVLTFTDSDRTLKTEYNLQDKNDWNNAIDNLARLAGFSRQEFVNVASTQLDEERQELRLRTNERLSKAFDDPWSQSKLTVSIDIQTDALLRIYVQADEGPTQRLLDRSDGLRAFVALVAFLGVKNLEVPPILVVDEAENHLHWDAQADLINLFSSHNKVAQIIYSTHSPGCLPHDLGHSVRAVLPDPNSLHHSIVDNSIWESSPGLRPLLLRMGASTAAMTPHRYAVMVEGVADFILLPSLLRDATGKDTLEYQIVPGISQATTEEIAEVDSESDIVFYLVDGDPGGRGHARKIRRVGILASRIDSLPNWSDAGRVGGS